MLVPIMVGVLMGSVLHVLANNLKVIVGERRTKDENDKKVSLALRRMLQGNPDDLPTRVPSLPCRRRAPTATGMCR